MGTKTSNRTKLKSSFNIPIILFAALWGTFFISMADQDAAIFYVFSFPFFLISILFTIRLLKSWKKMKLNSTANKTRI